MKTLKEHNMETNGQKKTSSFLQTGHLVAHVLVITAHQAVKFYFPNLQQKIELLKSTCNSDLVRASAKTSAPRMTTILLASFSGCPNLKICGKLQGFLKSPSRSLLLLSGH